jgi:FdhD protein
MPRESIASRPLERHRADAVESADDLVAVEAPLELRIDGRALAITLRTPGHDRELALGFLAAEGLIAATADVVAVELAAAACADEPDVADVRLAPGVRVDWSRLERHFAATSACGLCGRAHLESLRRGLSPMRHGGPFEAAALMRVPDRMREAQAAFAATGGIHAAACLDGALEPLVLREDVGRHNAVDKVNGWLLGEGRWPCTGGLLWISGRAGAEIVLKTARASIPVLAAVGAPSTLAITLAEAAGMTLIGFLAAGRMNVYTAPGRVRAARAGSA